jgi:hypothetical protein
MARAVLPSTGGRIEDEGVGVVISVTGYAGVVLRTRQRGRMMSSSEGGQVTGTRDKDYNLVWFTEQCMSNALRLETYVQDADRDGDSELAEFFRRAQAESKKGADQAKSMLGKRLSG